MQPATSANAPPDLEHSPPDKGWLPPSGLSLGNDSVYPGEGRPPHASVHPQQEPKEPTIVDEPSEMLGITHVQSASSAIAPPGPERSLQEGRWLLPPDLSTGTAIHASRERRADAVGLPSRSSTSVARKGATVATEFAPGKAVRASQGRKLLPLNYPSCQSHLPTKEG